MLDGNPPISAVEHRYFFFLTSLGLLIRIFEIGLALAFPEPPRPGISFGIYSIFDHWDLISPLYCFAAFLICLPLAWKLDSIVLIVSLGSLGLLACFFDYWFIDSQFRIREAAIINSNYEFKTFDFALISGSFFDVATLVIVNVPCRLADQFDRETSPN